jgi:hypothetical protein
MKRNLSLSLGMVVLLLLFSNLGLAQSYHLSYSGNVFNGNEPSRDYFKAANGYLYMPSGNGTHVAQVNFPDSATGLGVSRLSVSFLDNNNTAYLSLTLSKVDRWSGTWTAVGSVTTNGLGVSSAIRYLNIPKSALTGRGIDNNRYAFYLVVYFSGSGNTLRFYQATVRYE